MTKGSKRSDSPNKAEMIRQAFQTLEDKLESSAKDVQAFCEGKGVKNVAPAQISNVRTALLNKAAGTGSMKGYTAEELLDGVGFVTRHGGHAAAVAMLELLHKLKVGVKKPEKPRAKRKKKK